LIPGLVQKSVRHRSTTMLVWFGLLVGAGMIAVNLKLDALPDITSNQVQIITRAPGFTPEEVETLVTRRIEAALGGLPGLASHRSVSRESISSVIAVFGDDVDPWFARQLVAERLNTVELPEGPGTPELGPPTGGLGEIYHFSLSSPMRTGPELLELATWRVAPLLRRVADVVEINTWGGHQRTFEVRARPEALARYHLSYADLAERTGEQIGNAPGGAVEAGPRQSMLRARHRPTSTLELGATPIPVGGEGADRQALPLAQLAHIVEGAAPRLGAATSNGKGEVVYVMVQMLSHANARETVTRIREVMPAVKDVLPDDVEVQLIYDRAVLVDHTLDTISLNMIEGGALVVIVLLVMLGSLKAGLLVALIIPLAMLGGAALMTLLGIPGNLMSLGAIDFGLLVDGGVVMVEHVFADAEHRQKLPDRLEIERSTAAVGRPVFFSVLVIMLVYMPVLSLEGVDGKMFEPMAMAVVLALGVALVLSLTLVPALVPSAMPTRVEKLREPWVVRKWLKLHAAILGQVARGPALVFAIFIATMVFGYWRFQALGLEFVPQLDEGDLVIQTTRHPDIHLDRAVSENLKLEQTLLTFPEVERVVSRIGSPAVATDLMGLDQADIFVGLKPRSEWRPGLTRDALIASMEAALVALSPETELAFTQPIQMRFNELIGGSPTDVVINIFGEDLPVLDHLGASIVKALEGTTGIEDLRMLAPPAVELLEVTPRPDDCARHGLSAADVMSAVRAIRLGLPIASTRIGPVEVPIVLTAGDAITIAATEALVLPTHDGLLVPLTAVADVHTIATPGVIQHDNGFRRLLVGFNVRGAELGTVVADARARIADRVPMPDGFRIEWGGQVASLEAATARLGVVIPIVLGLIALTLYFAFHRVRPVLIVLTHVPFACVGGIVALELRDLPLSLSAAIGFIALSGIAVMNGVVLITEVLHLERRGHDRRSAGLTGARLRARPVLMTALVAALGFVPMMLSHGIGAEVQRPLATVVVGGLLTSTLLTLFILPTLYPFLGRRSAVTAAPAADDSH
jgi:cobalt-zinc-cadmium resistance protein CzcA